MKILTRIFMILFLTMACSTDVLASEQEKSAYEKIMETRKIRCGYIILPPQFSKDINTGAFSGIAYDLMNEIARRLNLEIEWTEEVNFATMVTGLQTKRYDAVCFSGYRYAGGIAVADFSVPIFYSATDVFVRADDTRFDKDLSAINDPSVTISTIDGEMAQFIVEQDFPKAKTLSMAPFTDLNQMMLNVETGKADVAFQNAIVAKGYLDAHPGKLKNIAHQKPIRIFSHGFMLPKGEYDLVRMFDLTIAEMHDHGAINKILDKYDPNDQTYLRVATPYALPK